MNNSGKNIFIWVIIAIVLVLVFNLFNQNQGQSRSAKLPYSEFLKTPITSVVQQTSELGQIAFKLLMAEINNKDSSKEQESLSKAKFVTLPTTLKERKSVKTIKQGKRILISKMKN